MEQMGSRQTSTAERWDYQSPVADEDNRVPQRHTSTQHKLKMDLTQFKWNQEPLEAIVDSGGCMQTKEENVHKWIQKSVRTIHTVTQGAWLVEMSRRLQLVPADIKNGKEEYYAIEMPWEHTSARVRLDEPIQQHTAVYSVILMYAIKCGCPITSDTGDEIFTEGATNRQAADEIKRMFDKLVGIMASYNSRIEKAIERELEMVVLDSRQNFAQHDFNAFGGVLMLQCVLNMYGTSHQSDRDDAATTVQKLVSIDISKRRAVDVRSWLMAIHTLIVQWRTSGATNEMVEQFATAPVLAKLEAMKDTRDGMEQEQWRALGAEANIWHKMRRSKNVEDHAGCKWVVVYSKLIKVYTELYGKGGLKPNINSMRAIPAMPMNVAYGAMESDGAPQGAPTVSAIEHMAFGAMTGAEYAGLTDGERHGAMMAALTSPPATVDDFTQLIKGRHIPGGPGLLFKGAMRGQQEKPGLKAGGLSTPPRRAQADTNPGKRRSDERTRVLRPQKPNFKCAHCTKFGWHYASSDWEDTTVAIKCSKCGKHRKEAPVEGKAMAAASTSAAGKTPLTIENVQDAVVKALATTAPTAAAFAGMHEMERGNGFGLVEHTAFGAMAEGQTADEENSGAEESSKVDTSSRRGPKHAKTITCLLTAVGALIAIFVGVATILALMSDYVGDVSSGILAFTRSWWSLVPAFIAAALGVGLVMPMAFIMFIGALPPTAAYSAAGIGYGAHAPAIYSARHLGARANLDPAAWAPVESSYGGQKNGTKSTKWAWGDVSGQVSDIIQQIAGRMPLGTAVSQREMEYCMQADTGMACGRYFVDSCCSKTIVRDRHLLKNVRPLATPARVAGLTGIKIIDKQADLHLPVTDVNGKRTVIIMEGVYYDPSVTYNLVSVKELAELNYEARFSKQASSVRGAAGIVPLIHTCNVYAIDAASDPTYVALGAVCKMTPMEKMHLYFSHCISEDKLLHMSKNKVPGIPPGLKKMGISCSVCQHAKIKRKKAAPAATGSDPHCISFDLIDMSNKRTVSGKRYCTMIVERETRFAHTVLHETKDEIVDVFKTVLPRLGKKAKCVMSDCAKEYNTPELVQLLKEHGVVEFRHSNEHGQAANGMVEKFGDTLGRGLRAALLQSGMPHAFWGAAVILVTDIYNSCPHASLNGDSPHFRRTGKHPDMSFFRPFGCGMVVYRGKDLVEHGKLAPRGEKGVYLGTGKQFGRRAFMCYSARLNRVFASVDCEFDATFFPYKLSDQRQRGYYDTELRTEELSMFHDMPNATQQDFIERLNSERVPCNTTWGLDMVMDKAAEMQPVDSTLIQGMPEDVRQAYGLRTEAGQQLDSAGENNSTSVHNLTVRDLKKTMDVHDRPGIYGEMQKTWQDAGRELLQHVTNERLAEYLIGMSTLILMPSDYWPEDGVQWSVNVTEHWASKRHQGGHAFQVLLAESTPVYAGAGGGGPFEVELSAKQMRTGIEREYGKGKTLEQMFDSKYTQPPSSLAQAAHAMTKKVASGLQKVKNGIRKRNQGKIERSEMNDTDESAVIASAMAATICEDDGIEFAGTPVAPRHYNAVFGRKDEALWVEAMDKEIIKCFEMGTWEIVDTADIPPECSVMGTCFSFKVKCDSDGKLLECRARANANGTQQKPGSYGETFAPTSKFSVIRTICAIAAQENLTLYQFDVKGAFLLAPCKEPVYMNLPGRYRLPPGKALKCRKLLYGLKQSAFGWHEMISGWLLDHGFENLDSDGVTFKKETVNKDGTVSKLLLTIHVDDAIVATNDDAFYKKFMDELGKSFELSASGKLTWFLGCKVEQDLIKGTVRMSQEKYCNDVLTRFKMSDANAVHTPCEANQHLQAADSPRLEDRDPNVVRDYQQAVGSCMFLTVFTRGDCAFAVNQCARFMSNPGPTHIAAIRRVLRYLAGTRSMGLTFRRTDEAHANQLYATADADHAGADDRRSVSGWAVMLNGAMVSWASKRQPVTAISSTESEFYSVSLCGLDCVYLRRMMEMMGYKQLGATAIAQDNNACIFLVKGSGMYNRARHIDTRVYRIRELAAGASPEVKLFKIAGTDQPSDLFTKGLPRPAFEKYRAVLMGEVPSTLHKNT